MSPPRHILVLADREWTHPQAGGTGTALFGRVSPWIAAGHRVTLVAGTYPGAEPVSRPHERLRGDGRGRAIAGARLHVGQHCIGQP